MGPFLVLCPRHCATMTAAHSTFGVRPDGAGGGDSSPCLRLSRAELTNVNTNYARRYPEEPSNQ